MDRWESYFADEGDIARIPQGEVYEFIADLEKQFSERPLRIWDLCCGAGRRTVALARIGHEVYASDGSAKAIDLTRQWVMEAKLTATTSTAEMAACSDNRN